RSPRTAQVSRSGRACTRSRRRPPEPARSTPRAAWGLRTGSRRPSQVGSFGQPFVLVLADRLGPDDRATWQPGLGHRLLELPRRLLDRLIAAVGLNDQLSAVEVASDAGGDAVVLGDRVSQLDYFLAGQHPVTLGLEAYTPSH